MNQFLIYQIIHLRCISNILKRPFKKFILFLFSRRRPPKTTKTYTRREWSQSFGYGASPSSKITGCNPSTTTGKSISRKNLIIFFRQFCIFLSFFRENEIFCFMFYIIATSTATKSIPIEIRWSGTCWVYHGWTSRSSGWPWWWWCRGGFNQWSFC